MTAKPIDIEAIRARHSPPGPCAVCGDPMSFDFHGDDGDRWGCTPGPGKAALRHYIYREPRDPGVVALCDEVDRLRADVHRLSLIHDREQHIAALEHAFRNGKGVDVPSLSKIQPGDYVHPTLRDDVARCIRPLRWVCMSCGIVHAASHAGSLLDADVGMVCLDGNCARRLSVWTNDIDKVVAYSADDALDVYLEHTGQERAAALAELAERGESWSRVPDDEAISIINDDGPGKTLMAAEQWCAVNGRGFLCSTEF